MVVATAVRKAAERTVCRLSPALALETAAEITLHCPVEAAEVLLFDLRGAKTGL